MEKKRTTNRLSDELSPYLQQHAHNPVDWFPWGDEAFERARSEDKPILVSIGYSSCHWCHVMERESFEDESTAAFMNRHFVNIKVDREERPDVDEVYMEAVQYMTGSGGWPLNCFLLPDGRPYFGGTYYPPLPAYNRPSWMQVLIRASKLYEDQRELVMAHAGKLSEMIRDGSGQFLRGQATAETLSSGIAGSILPAIEGQWDTANGGFGSAPKFPHFMTIDLLILLAHFGFGREACDHATFTLERMLRAGIYDQVGGGIARYATDPAWNVPHFEKMLYDNALLIGTLAKMARSSGESVWRERLEDVLTFLDRDFGRDGGYMSAWDADSEGEEGKYYTWTDEELRRLLPGDEWVLDLFEVKEGGNWEEGKNILWRDSDWDSFARERNMDADSLRARWEEVRKVLLNAREKRVRPGEDDKIILSWNAMLSWSLAEVAPLMEGGARNRKGLDHLEWLWDTFSDPDSGRLLRVHKDGHTYQEGMLEDYAYLIKAQLSWFAYSQDLELLRRSKALTDSCYEHFFDEERSAFLSGPGGHLPMRQIALYDNSTPSPNAVMSENLLLLSHLYDEDRYRETAERILDGILSSVTRHPLAFSYWAQVLLKRERGIRELSIIGKDCEEALHVIRSRWWIPEGIYFARQQADEDWPLSVDKDGGEKTYIYLCDRFGCRPPVASPDELKAIL